MQCEALRRKQKDGLKTCMLKTCYNFVYFFCLPEKFGLFEIAPTSPKSKIWPKRGLKQQMEKSHVSCKIFYAGYVPKMRTGLVDSPDFYELCPCRASFSPSRRRTLASSMAILSFSSSTSEAPMSPRFAPSSSIGQVGW